MLFDTEGEELESERSAEFPTLLENGMFCNRKLTQEIHSVKLPLQRRLGV